MNVTFVVKAGDSLWSIAQANNTTLGEIKKLNPQYFAADRNPDLIYPGEKVVVPATPCFSSNLNLQTGAMHCPPNGPFATRDDAARAALTRANPDSIADNLEYSGLIYEDAEGHFYYTGPAQGTDQGAQPWTDAPIPANTTEMGYYHTHGDYSTFDPATGRAVRTSDPNNDDFNSDNFSGADRRAAASAGSANSDYRGYLAGPGGTFRRYDPATGDDDAF